VEESGTIAPEINTGAFWWKTTNWGGGAKPKDSMPFSVKKHDFSFVTLQHKTKN
jgi:hypothetical protein